MLLLDNSHSLLCPVQALKYYLEHTQNEGTVRRHSSSLILTSPASLLRMPCRVGSWLPVTWQASLSCWIMATSNLAGKLVMLDHGYQ